MEAAKVEVTPEQRVREIDEELPRLEEQRESAAGKIQGADRALSKIKRRQEALAVAVVGEDEAATAENDELTDACVQEERAAVARSAHTQLEAKIAEMKTAREKAVRAVHQERYNELAKERGHLDVRIEGAVGELREGLSELEDIHNRQLIEAQGAGDPLLSHVAETHLQSVLQSWLGARSGWLVPTTAATLLYGAPLPESDRLAIAPKAEPEAE